jgi:hypothetical protein
MTSFPERFPLMATVVFAPAHEGMRMWTAKSSARASLNSNCDVFARGYSVICVSAQCVLFWMQETREAETN